MESTQNDFKKQEEDFRKFAERVNKEVHDRANILKENGHTCIKYLQTFPQQLSWCDQEPCKYTKK